MFSRQDNLVAHVNTIHSSTERNGSQRICDVCGKECKSNKAMCDHLRIHKKKYVCYVCNARFGQRYKLQRHIASHNQSKEQCPKCSKLFMQLKEHMKRCKGTSAEAVEGKPIFTCTTCNKSFKEKRYLNQHNKNVHEHIFYECQHCKASFRHRSSRLFHLRKEHLEEN